MYRLEHCNVVGRGYIFNPITGASPPPASFSALFGKRLNPISGRGVFLSSPRVFLKYLPNGGLS